MMQASGTVSVKTLAALTAWLVLLGAAAEVWKS